MRRRIHDLVSHVFPDLRPNADWKPRRTARALFAVTGRADPDRIKHDRFPAFVRCLARNLLGLENRFRDGAEVEEETRDDF